MSQESEVSSVSCNECGGYIIPPANSTNYKLCDCFKGKQPVGMYGWICPNCGKGVNPNYATCPCTMDMIVTCRHPHPAINYPVEFPWTTTITRTNEESQS